MKNRLKSEPKAAERRRCGVFDERTHFLVRQWLMKVYLNPCRTLSSCAGNARQLYPEPGGIADLRQE